LIRLVFGYEQENVAATARSLDPTALSKAARAINSARGVIVVGSGVGRAVVNLLGGHLSRIRGAVSIPTDSVDAVIALANAGPRDVVVAVSFWRFARSTRDVLALAKHRGVTTVAIVDSPLYPAGQFVDHLLVVSSRNPGHGPSTVAADAVANALISATILTDFPRYLAAIEHVDDAYAESGAYLE
jgi:DNA-binding MurR/RpiR family transcriptional regulator